MVLTGTFRLIKASESHTFSTGTTAVKLTGVQPGRRDEDKSSFINVTVIAKDKEYDRLIKLGKDSVVRVDFNIDKVNEGEKANNVYGSAWPSDVKVVSYTVSEGASDPSGTPKEASDPFAD